MFKVFVRSFVSLLVCHFILGVMLLDKLIAHDNVAIMKKAFRILDEFFPEVVNFELVNSLLFFWRFPLFDDMSSSHCDYVAFLKKYIDY